MQEILVTDIDLVNSMSEGDESAFQEIYRRYWYKLYTVANRKSGSEEDAEEIVQDIFISLWNRRDSIQITTTLNAYLAVSVKYRVIKILAKRNQQSKYADKPRAFHHLQQPVL